MSKPTETSSSSTGRVRDHFRAKAFSFDALYDEDHALQRTLRPGLFDRRELALDVVHLPSQAQRLAWLVDALPRMEGCGIVYTLTVRDPALVADLRDFFRAWGCISTEASSDTIQVLLPGAPTEPQAELQIRTCLGAWLATHPGVEAEIIA